MIGARIKKLRKQNKLSQQAFASLLTTSSGYISEVEQGKAQPGSNFLVSLKRAFPDLDLNWLLTGEGEMRQSGLEAMPVDADVLERVIEAVGVCLDQVGGHLKPAKKAQVIVTLYEMVIADTEKKIEEGKVLQLVRLAL